MKKLFMLLALVLGVVSCQNEPEGFDVNVGGEQDVNITVSLPESTRGTSSAGFDFTEFETNGTYDLRFILEIRHNGEVVRAVETSNTTSMMFPVRLAPNREYTFTVWADLVEEGKKTDLYYNTADLSNITFKNWTPNVEARDAYTLSKTITFNAGADLSMELKRPFAKVRVVATDIDDIDKFGIVPTNAVADYFTAEMYTKFDAVNGRASEVATKKHEFIYTNVDKYKDVDGQFTVFADYVFVPEDGNVQFKLDVNAANGLIKSNSFNTAIPVEANKVTSIVGSVLTEGGNVNITVDSVLGEKETFTYISSGAELLKVIKNQNSGKYILGCNIDVDENDVALAGTLSATRSTTTETVINLNGYTITINNKSNKPLVTVAEGNTLTFAGAGNIVMTSESTAPFVENKNENGGVIIEEATVTNESTNQEATIVKGTAVVNEGVEIEGNVASEETTSQLDYVLANGGEVTLLKDVTSNKILEISATNPVVINGNGKTISFTSNRGFRVTASNNVTIENATIVNNVDYGRCIETRTGNINLTLNNVNLTATQTGSQPFTVGGSGIDVTVNINNSTINAGKGYGITTFNPTALTINNSTVTGYAALNIKVASSSEGSAGSVINVTGSTLAGVNNWPGVSNACSTIMLEDSNVTINIDSTSTVEAYATANIQTAISLGNELVDRLIGNCDITIAGTVVLEGKDARYALCSTYQGSTGTNAVKFKAEYAEELQAEGWIVSEPTDSLVTIASAVAKLKDTEYKTLEEAVAVAETGDTIELINNVALSEPVVIESGKNVVLNLNGKTLTATNYAIENYGTLTINGNGTINGIVYGENGTTTVENGTFNPADGGAYVFLNSTAGTLIINGGTINTGSSYPVYSYNENNKLIINDVTINGKFGCVNAYGNGAKAVINGGTFKMTGVQGNTSHIVYFSQNITATINGGTFEKIGDINMSGTGGGGICVNGGANLTINGGNFAGDYSDVYNWGGTISIKGGTYKHKPENFVAEGKVAVQGADGRWTLVDGVMDEAGLKAAFEQGGNIVLGADITVSETIVLAEGKTATLDLNGKTLSAADMNVIKNNGGNLTIKNGTVTRTGDAVGYSVNNASGEINVVDATVERGLYTSGSKMTATNANISHEQSSRHAIYAWNCEVTINSGTFHNDNAGNATLMASGSSIVTINGGTFSIADGRSTIGWTSSMIDQNNTAQVIVKGGLFNGGFRINSTTTTLTIEGGEFNTNNGSAFTDYSGTKVVKGGKFTDAGAQNWAKKYIAEGYEMNANGEVVAK